MSASYDPTQKRFTAVLRVTFDIDVAFNTTLGLEAIELEVAEHIQKAFATSNVDTCVLFVDDAAQSGSLP